MTSLEMLVRVTVHDTIDLDEVAQAVEHTLRVLEWEDGSAADTYEVEVLNVSEIPR